MLLGRQVFLLIKEQYNYNVIYIALLVVNLVILGWGHPLTEWDVQSSLRQRSMYIHVCYSTQHCSKRRHYMQTHILPENAAYYHGARCSDGEIDACNGGQDDDSR